MYQYPQRLLSRGGGCFLCFDYLLALKQVTQEEFSGVCLLWNIDFLCELTVTLA